MESYGPRPICAETLTFLSELGRRMSAVTGATCAKQPSTFLSQRLSVAIQRFTCILFKYYLFIYLFH